MSIIKQEWITSLEDIIALNIIDWNRLNGYWNNPMDAMKTIGYSLINSTIVTICEIPNFHNAPMRDDFPGWKHVGDHEEIGKAYWNWFFLNHPDGKLRFSDSPDFNGQIGDAFFWGDIGKVSPIGFREGTINVREGDLWISIPYDGVRQIILEHQIDKFITFDCPDQKIQQIRIVI